MKRYVVKITNPTVRHLRMHNLLKLCEYGAGRSHWNLDTDSNDLTLPLCKSCARVLARLNNEADPR